jgi:hypothetical protein
VHGSNTRRSDFSPEAAIRDTAIFPPSEAHDGFARLAVPESHRAWVAEPFAFVT